MRRALLAALLAATLTAGCDRGARAREEQAAAERARAAAVALAERGDTVVGLPRPLAMAAIARRLARESYRLRWYDAQQWFIEAAPSDTSPPVRIEFRTVRGDSTAIAVLDSVGKPGNGRGVPVARQVAWAALAAAASDTTAAASDAARIVRDIRWTTLPEGRDAMCRHVPPPERWVIADTRHDPARCLLDRLFGYHYNVSVIERYDSLVVGAILTACVGSPLPPGWIANMTMVDLDRCPNEPGTRREQANVVVFKSPPRVDKLPPRGPPQRPDP